jgi:glycerol-3-phosphate dehydrogenase (NAD(P)+)
VTAPAVGVVGGGGFGRALAQALQRNQREVILWSRHSFDLEGVRVTTELASLREAELLLLAVPSPYVQATADALGRHLDGSHLLVHVSRGLVGDDLLTLSRVLRRRTPCRRIGALAGPLDADALANGEPTGAIVGTRFPEVTAAVREALDSDSLRIYDSRDIVGVELASAVVGYLALAAGVGRELDVSPATVAILLTRGMAEAARWAPALGADPTTLYGMAGQGDLLAVAGGDVRPEVRLGRALASGADLEAAGKAAGAHIEGVTIARRVASYAAKVGVETPVAAMIAAVVEGRLSARDAIGALMARDVGKE